MRTMPDGAEKSGRAKDAIIVSNHGGTPAGRGHQLYPRTGQSILDAVGRQIEVHLDSENQIRPRTCSRHGEMGAKGTYIGRA